MTKQQKTVVIDELKEKFSDAKYFYLTDCSTLTVEKVNNLRRKCFEKGIELRVIKNTLIRKALQQIDHVEYASLYDVLHGPTAVMFAENAKIPAELIEEFRKNSDRPLLKAAYVESAIFIGDSQLETLLKLKSKNELIGELLGLLESPMSNLLSLLNSGGITIHRILETLSER